MNIQIEKKIKDKIHEYYSVEFKKKIDTSELLISCGNLLLEELKNHPKNDKAKYYTIRIANELHFITDWMAYTKKYDTSPQIKINYELAFKLAYHHFELKPHYRLIPFVVKLLYYEQFNKESSKTSLNDVYNKCLESLNKFTNEINTSERPWYSIDF